MSIHLDTDKQQDYIEPYDLIDKKVIADTLYTWRKTRLEGVSASFVSGGEISINLLRAFDTVARTGLVNPIKSKG